MRPIVPEKRVKFGDPHFETVIEKFHPKPSEAAFSRDNFRLEVVSCVISGVALSMDVPVNLGDSRSNCSRDVRAAHFVMDDE